MALVPADLRSKRWIGRRGVGLSVAAWSSERPALVPGSVVAVQYVEEPDLHHERLLLMPSRGGWWTLTPDGEYELLDTQGVGADPPLQVVSLPDSGRALPWLRGRFYRFPSYPEDEEFEKARREALARERRRFPGKKPEEVTEVLDMGGERRGTAAAVEEATEIPSAAPPLSAPPPGAGRTDRSTTG